jgi:hypothetical protein
MALWLGALIVLLLATGAGLTYAAWRGLQLWRLSRRTLKVLGAGGDRITEGLATLSASSEQLAAAPGRVGAAAANLRRAVAQAAVVVEALGETRSAAEAVTRLRRR